MARLCELVRHVSGDGRPRLLISVPLDARTFDHLLDGHSLVPGTTVPKPEPVFPRVVEDEAAVGA